MGLLFLQNIHVCLGGLFVPEAYITATRQYVAQANSWSLEELTLEVNVTASQSATLDACSFGVTGELGLCLQVAPLRSLPPHECSASGRTGTEDALCAGLGGCGPLQPVSTFPHRFETSRGHMQQQQAVALQRHLHSPPANTAALGEANQC